MAEGRPWSEGEIAELARRRAAGETMPRIADALGRSVKACERRSARMGLRCGAADGPAQSRASSGTFGHDRAAERPNGAATVAAPGVELVAPTVHRWRIPAERGPSWEHWTLIISDLHYDSPECRRDLLRWHLDQARARRAAVCVIGDAHDAMQGKYDPRHHKAGVRSEYLRDDYLWCLVDYMAALIAEYPDLGWLLTAGNHETAILKRLEYDLIGMTAKEANNRRGSGAPPVAVGAYAGWIVWEIVEPGGRKQERVTHYDHGSGGGGPVTRGVIGTNRRAVYTPDADEVWTGHIHEAWYVEVPRERLGAAGTSIDVQAHVCLGAYKEERLRGHGYHVEKGRAPKPLGGWWRRLYWSHLEPKGYRAQYIRTEW